MTGTLPVGWIRDRSDGEPCFQALCECGYNGPYRYDRRRAQRDLRGHQQAMDAGPQIACALKAVAS